MKKIFITHCSAKKDLTLKVSGKKVASDLLYTATPLQRFVQQCKNQRVEWAIFSDEYGIIFPWEEIGWYEKHPSNVNDEEFEILLDNFIHRLSDYDEIWFYHNPGRFHPLYRRILEDVQIKGLKIILFSHIAEIR